LLFFSTSTSSTVSSFLIFASYVYLRFLQLFVLLLHLRLRRHRL
jgi:hypothetical protein